VRKRNIQHTTPANRSVFYDLGFDEAEARVLAMRADLMAALRQHIKGRGWTQSKAAKELGITQPRSIQEKQNHQRRFASHSEVVTRADPIGPGRASKARQYCAAVAGHCDEIFLVREVLAVELGRPATVSAVEADKRVD
jgi:predicted XRE-type DNA-binding protein